MVKSIADILKWLEELVLVLLSAGVVFIVFYGVLVRYLPISADQMAWTEELSLLFLVWLAFISASTVQREDGHFKVDVLLKLFGGNIRVIITTIIHLLSAAFCAFVAQNAFGVIQSISGDVSTILRFPMVLVPLSLFTGSCLMVVYSIGLMVVNFKNLRGKSRTI
jgi:TRAP-type C4-dicarboxylate transport system permease small subunit